MRKWFVFLTILCGILVLCIIGTILYIHCNQIPADSTMALISQSCVSLFVSLLAATSALLVLNIEIVEHNKQQNLKQKQAKDHSIACYKAYVKAVSNYIKEVTLPIADLLPKYADELNKYRLNETLCPPYYHGSREKLPEVFYLSLVRIEAKLNEVELFNESLRSYLIHVDSPNEIEPHSISQVNEHKLFLLQSREQRLSALKHLISQLPTE